MKRLVVVVWLSLMVSGCAPTPAQTKKTEGTHGLEYRIVEIEGMPCVWIKRGIGDTSYAGVSCDWSKRAETQKGN